MKKVIIAVTIAISSISAFANDMCKPTEMLKTGSVATGVGAAAALIIPGAGPFIATGIMVGTITTTANVAVCAYDDYQKEENTRKFKKAAKQAREDILSLFEKKEEVEPSIVEKAKEGTQIAFNTTKNSVKELYNNLSK